MASQFRKLMNKKIFGKKSGEWIHYPVVLGILTLYLIIFQTNLTGFLGFIGGLVIFIISDILAEAIFIRGKLEW